MSFTVRIKNLENTSYVYDHPVIMEDILKQVQDKLPYRIYVGKLDNAYRALTHKVTHDCEIEFLDMSNQEAWLVYQNSLVLLFIKAVHDVLGRDTLVTIRNSLNKGLYITVTKPLDQETVDRLASYMQALAKQDLPIRKEHLAQKQAMDLATKLKQQETVKLLKSIKNIDDIEIYSLGEEVQIFYNLLVPSTGYLQLFELKYYRRGILMRYPHPLTPEAIPNYQDQTLLYDAFSEANRWGQLMNINFVCDLNERINRQEMDDLYLLQEALHEKRISDIADMIKEQGKRVVLICGPSSSGKTTFAKRLCIQLQVNGLKTLYLGTDDYYKEFAERVYDEDGEPDLESIRSLDVDLFQRNLVDLLDGKEVDLPRFDFNIIGKVYGERITRLKKNQVIVIEGIHGLNHALTERIDDGEKFKIYISPFTPISIDHHNRIPSTDARLLRRMVRDYQFRNRGVEGTIALWPKVRAGEENNIFPYSQEADVFFNSNCIYELSVIKKFAEPLLREITRDKPEYAEAQRLLSFMKYFDATEDEQEIVNNSIIREFIGGSTIVK